jgi:hypothetical protein
MPTGICQSSAPSAAPEPAVRLIVSDARDGMVELVECYRAGMIVRDPAEKVSISTSSVKRILRRAGARKPPG